MPGPLPKDPSIRQRGNKPRSSAMLVTDNVPRSEAPKLPDRAPDGHLWHPMAKQFWTDVWNSPMHFEFLRGDEPALFRLLALVNKFWRENQSISLAAEIRNLEREFGLTPLSRRRLEWQVMQSEDAKDRTEQKRVRRAVIIDGKDPREVLK